MCEMKEMKPSKGSKEYLCREIKQYPKGVKEWAVGAKIQQMQKL